MSFIFLNILISAQNIPLIINSDEKVIEDTVKLISKTLPKGIEILIYNPNIINTDTRTALKIEKRAIELFSANSSKYNIKITTENDAKGKSEDIKKMLENYPGEEDLVTLGLLLKCDAVLIINITKLRHEIRSIWDADAKSIVKKDIYILQGNLFNPENHRVFIRFFNYMYI